MKNSDVRCLAGLLPAAGIVVIVATPALFGPTGINPEDEIWIDGPRVV
jgi:hypothetical protein